LTPVKLSTNSELAQTLLMTVGSTSALLFWKCAALLEASCWS